MSALDDARAALAAYDKVRADVTGESGSWGYPGLRDDFNRTAHAAAEALRIILTTPPTDDEREALDYAIRVPLSELRVEYKPFWKMVRAVQDSVVAAGFRRQGPIADALATIRSSWEVVRGAQRDMLNGRADMDAMEEIALASSQIDAALEAARTVS